ncbi:MAG TPA: hypothetical protein VEC57_00290 [Candidatus Limnocylindrales bacterium]|nr:hypothetical protein [Candidatus Limnocylindrales bacterium]
MNDDLDPQGAPENEALSIRIVPFNSLFAVEIKWPCGDRSDAFGNPDFLFSHTRDVLANYIAQATKQPAP